MDNSGATLQTELTALAYGGRLHLTQCQLMVGYQDYAATPPIVHEENLTR